MVKVNIPGINKVRAKGRDYYYHRATGKRIRSAFGSAAFLAEVEALSGGPVQAKGGSLGHLIGEYRASPEFSQLAPETRKDYQEVFDYLYPMRDMPAIALDTPMVIGIRDRAFARHKRWFANYCVKVISLVCTWGRPRGLIQTNPAADVPLLKRPRNAPVVNRPWTEDEVKAVLEASPLWLKVPIALALFLGMRVTDALRVPWSAYDGQVMTWRQSKTGEENTVPVARALRELLATERERQATVTARKLRRGRPAVVGATTIVQGMRGRPFTRSGFRASFTKLVTGLRKKLLVGTGLTFHGGRHTVATILAERGADAATIIGLTGHANESGVRTYIRTAQRRVSARRAVALLEAPEEQAEDAVCKTPGTRLQNRPEGTR